MSNPTTVEVGQIWRDNDQRTKGAGEFTVLAVVDSGHGDTTWLPGVGVDVSRRASAIAAKAGEWNLDDFPSAIVQRKGGRLTRIRCDRLLSGGNTQRGYTYLGMSR